MNISSMMASMQSKFLSRGLVYLYSTFLLVDEVFHRHVLTERGLYLLARDEGFDHLGLLGGLPRASLGVAIGLVNVYLLLHFFGGLRVLHHAHVLA